MLKNQQAPTPVVRSEGLELLVHSIFYTIQGEGPFAGMPAVFLRLGGCNLQCPLCDTEYSDNATLDPTEDVVARVYALASEHDATLVVITGGEPFRQNLSLLLYELIDAGLHPQIESNGKLLPQDSDEVLDFFREGKATLVISPKTHRINALMAEHAAAFKYVVKAGDVSSDGLPISALDHPLPKDRTIARPPEGYERSIFIQPVDTQDPAENEKHLAQAVRSVMEYSDHRRRLCLQIHKTAGLE